MKRILQLIAPPLAELGESVFGLMLLFSYAVVVGAGFFIGVATVASLCK